MAALVPPFTASDMQGLYKKIIRGVYPNIPSQYSPDLSNVIRTLLQVNPTLRPSCEKILEMPPVQRHINIQYAPNPQGADLLGTIKFEPGFKNLKQKLPGPKYDLRNRGLSAHSTRPKIEEALPVRLASARGREPQGQIDGSKPLPKVYQDMQKYDPPSRIAPIKAEYEPPSRIAPVKAEYDYRPQIRDSRYQPRPEVHEPIAKKESDPLIRKPIGPPIGQKEELFKIPEAKANYTPYVAPYRADRYAQLYNEINPKPSNPISKAPSYENIYPSKPASREANYQIKPSSREAPYQIKPSSRENNSQIKPQSRDNASYLKSPNKPINPYPVSKPQSRENPSSYQPYINKPPSRENPPSYQPYPIKPPSRENPPSYQPYPNKPPSRENKITPSYIVSPSSKGQGYIPPREVPASRENKIGNYYIPQREVANSRPSSGLDPNKNLNRIGALVLQTPKQIMPKGISSPQANPSSRGPQGSRQQRINPVWWG